MIKIIFCSFHALLKLSLFYGFDFRFCNTTANVLEITRPYLFPVQDKTFERHFRKIKAYLFPACCNTAQSAMNFKSLFQIFTTALSVTHLSPYCLCPHHVITLFCYHVVWAETAGGKKALGVRTVRQVNKLIDGCIIERSIIG